VLGLAACGGSDAGAGTTSAAPIGPPLPSTTLPAWIPPTLGAAGEDAFLEVVRHDLSLRGLRFTVDDLLGTAILEDGRIVALSPIAQLAAQSDPTTWPEIVARSLDTLLAP
jgi:hypothetical protein